jgi:hypothetical protein
VNKKITNQSKGVQNIFIFIFWGSLGYAVLKKLTQTPNAEHRFYQFKDQSHQYLYCFKV